VTQRASLPPVETLATIDSTNAEAKRRALSGSRGPLWLRADVQSGGVGRGGREWYSPEGNLYATLLTPFNGEMRDAALVSFVACLAVALLEAGGEPDTRWLAIGIGINLLHKPSEARWPPIALADLTAPPSPAESLETLARSFDAWMTEFEKFGFSPIREAWLSRAAHLGERIEARLANRTQTGIFQGLGEDGALLLATDQGDIRITAADIYFST